MSQPREILFILGVMGVTLILVLAIWAFMWWKVFEKAGKKGWISVVPFYNAYTLFEISGKPGWWFAFGFIPYLGGIVVFILRLIANVELAQKFGKSAAFGVGLSFLGIIFFPILGFGDATYDHSEEPLSGPDDILDTPGVVN